MANSIYQINKGINRSIEFRGLKAQYIWYMLAVIFGMLVIYGIMYGFGVNNYINLLIVLSLGGYLTMCVYRMSNTYGEHGLTKLMAKRGLPKVMKSHSRMVFMKLKKG